MIFFSKKQLQEFSNIIINSFYDIDRFYRIVKERIKNPDNSKIKDIDINKIANDILQKESTTLYKFKNTINEKQRYINQRIRDYRNCSESSFRYLVNSNNVELRYLFDDMKSIKYEFDSCLKKHKDEVDKICKLEEFENYHLLGEEKTILDHLVDTGDDEAEQILKEVNQRIKYLKDTIDTVKDIHTRNQNYNEPELYKQLSLDERNFPNEDTNEKKKKEEDTEENKLVSNRNMPIIKGGIIEKKSDKGITWEKRFVIITKTKFYYWYTYEFSLFSSVFLFLLFLPILISRIWSLLTFLKLFYF